MTHSIGIIGAGAWGTALAQMYAAAGREVVLWARDGALVERINTAHENPTYLGGVPLCAAIRATTNKAAAFAQDIVLLVVPSQHIRGVLEDVAKPLVICAKGVEKGTGMLLPDVVEAVCPRAQVAILSGPCFAAEVARGLPAAATLVGGGETLQHALATPTFRPYMSNDAVGVALGGALKNVVAIACGMVMGRGLGENARAALITRGLAEMGRLIVAAGGQAQTAMGLSGVGDLVLTASSLQSRNYSLGFALGQGRSVAEILGPRKAVTEGVAGAGAVLTLAASHGVDMPIAQAVWAVLEGDLTLEAATQALLSRPLGVE